jgi:hypothetical protein
MKDLLDALAEGGIYLKKIFIDGIYPIYDL